MTNTSHDDDQRIERYIARISELEVDEGPTLDTETLQQIAREVGVSETDLARANEKVQQALERGEKLTRMDRYDEAITTLRLAVDLAPYEAAPACELGRVYIEKWRAHGRPSDRESALHMLQRARSIEPDNKPAKWLFQEIEEVEASHKRRQQASAAGRRAKIWRSLMVLFGCVGLGAMGMEFFDRYQSPGQPPTQTAKPAVTTAADRSNQAVRTGDRTPKVHFEAGDKLAGSALDNVRSVVSTLPSSRLYRLGAELQYRGQTELEALELRVDLLAPNGEVIASKLIKPVRRYGIPVRPGDWIPLKMMLRPAAEVHRVKVSVVMALMGPAVETYPQSPVVALQWVARQPPGMNVTTRQRARSVRAHGKDGSLYDVVVEVENSATLAIRQLRIDMRLLDERSEVIATTSRFVVSSSGPPLLAGNTRVVRFLLSTKQQAKSNVLVVSEIR